MNKTDLDIAIIGGGAAGFFAAINCKIKYPNYRVTIYEKSKKTLSKVKVSGGGRCNVTNSTFSISDLLKNYPRGNKHLKKVFHQFNVKHTVDWFESRGVSLVTQNDKCIFPKSQNSQTVIDCFNNECKRLGVVIKTESHLTDITPHNGVYNLIFKSFNLKADKVIIAIGGQPKINGFDFLKQTDHKIISPVPSLFTFNMPNEPIKELMGVVVENAKTRIQGTKLIENGPLLITHWGMSGPAILKLSAWGARLLNEVGYKFNIQVDWLNSFNYDSLIIHLKNEISIHPQKKISNHKVVELPSRLWFFLLKKINLNLEKKWSEISKRELNQLVNILVNDVYKVEGKTTFKEEFVTCGGVDLNSIDFNTMQSKLYKGLYFTGEGIDIDGITGGFNFQAAWSTGYVASQLK